MEAANLGLYDILDLILTKYPLLINISSKFKARVYKM